MKIFQHIKSLTQKVVNKLLDFVAPNRHKLSDKKKNDSQHRKIKKKRSNKRRSFDNSFIMNPFRRLQRLSRSHRKQRKFSFLSKLIGRQQSQSLQQIKSQSSGHSQLHLGQIATNEVIMVAQGIQISDSQLFLDNNGLEISAIEPQDKGVAQQNQGDSDSSLLKFLAVDEEIKLKPIKTFEKIQRKIEYIIPKRREWWIEALQSEKISSSSAEIEKKQVEQVVEQQSKQFPIKSKTKKIKKKKHEEMKKNSSELKNKMKVIEIIDLVQNQDKPKIFHFPICKPLIL